MSLSEFIKLILTRPTKSLRCRDKISEEIQDLITHGEQHRARVAVEKSQDNVVRVANEVIRVMQENG